MTLPSDDFMRLEANLEASLEDKVKGIAPSLHVIGHTEQNMPIFGGSPTSPSERKRLKESGFSYGTWKARRFERIRGWS